MKISASCYVASGFGFEPPWAVNAGFATGSAETLIVDAGPSAFAARTILGYARAVRPANRLRAVNTEQHLDHILGNGILADEGIPILGHESIQRDPADLESAIEALSAAASDPRRRAAREGRFFFAGTRLQNPTVKLSSETACDLGGLTARILPAPGHTPSNLLVWVEAERVLFAGDTVVSGYLPNLESGDAELWRTWLAALDRIEALQPETLVPGHGEVLCGARILAELDRIRAVLRQAVSEAG